MKTKLSFLMVIVLLTTLLGGGIASPIPAAAGPQPPNDPYPPPNTESAGNLDYRLLAKAEPDECFDAVGQPSTCSEGEVPNKVNQAYVWGLTQSGDNLWFGTAANVVCLANALLGSTVPVQNESYVCEFGSSAYVHPIYGVPLGKINPAVGDWRPPEVWAYNTNTDTLVDKTPADRNIYFTVGLRAAGSLGDLVLLGGPGFGSGLNLFAYNGATGGYLGSIVLSEYNNIRKMLAYDGVLYVAVGSTTGGAVLKWTGTVGDPFHYEVVGNLDSDAAEIVAYDRRIFVSTWPAMPGTGGGIGAYSGLYMSPPVRAGGLTPADADLWEKVFEITDYEPDPVTAYTVAAGGIASFGGYLYWSTLHVPGTGVAAFVQAYGEPANDAEYALAFLNTYRPTVVFRGKDFGTKKQVVDLLYGDRTLPVYTGERWTRMPNKMGATPPYGGAGFGNYFNTYTWSMEVYDGKLYAGTFDWSYLAGLGVTQYLPLPIPLLGVNYGADLFRFDSTKKAAKPVSVHGVGNYLNYGIRNMLAATNGKLYLGSANPMNLETAAGEPNGGWELIELSKM